MTIFEKTAWNSAISDEAQPLTPAHFGYFQGRLRNRLYGELIKLFMQKRNTGLTRADLARRLGKKPEQVTRWLSGPGNLKIDTLSDLLLAMGHELDIRLVPIETRASSNHTHDLVAIEHPKASSPSKNKISLVK
jgi:transcriptional regulator with XRE-family HTH domain